MIGAVNFIYDDNKVGFFFCDFQNVTDILNNIFSLSRNALFIETLCAANTPKYHFCGIFREIDVFLAKQI